jgi:hypothetical protein
VSWKGRDRARRESERRSDIRVIQLFVPLNHLKTSFATCSRPLPGLAVAVAKSLYRIVYMRIVYKSS